MCVWCLVVVLVYSRNTQLPPHPAPSPLRAAPIIEARFSSLSCARRNWKDSGHFITGALIVTGFALPAVLAHAGLVNPYSSILSLCGGLIVYASLLLYLHFFHNKKEEDDFAM